MSSAMQRFEDDDSEDKVEMVVELPTQPIFEDLSKETHNQELVLKYFLVRKRDGKCVILLQTAITLEKHTDATNHTTVNHLPVECTYSAKLNTTFAICVVDRKAPRAGCACDAAAKPFVCKCGAGHAFRITHVTMSIHNQRDAPDEIKTTGQLLRTLETQNYARCWC